MDRFNKARLKEYHLRRKLWREGYIDWPDVLSICKYPLSHKSTWQEIKKERDDSNRT